MNLEEGANIVPQLYFIWINIRIRLDLLNIQVDDRGDNSAEHQLAGRSQLSIKIYLQTISHRDKER